MISCSEIEKLPRDPEALLEVIRGMREENDRQQATITALRTENADSWIVFSLFVFHGYYSSDFFNNFVKNIEFRKVLLYNFESGNYKISYHSSEACKPIMKNRAGKTLPAYRKQVHSCKGGC